MNTRDCIDGGTLLLFSAGELGPDDRREVEEHLASCSSCASVLAGLSQLVESLVGLARVGDGDEDVRGSGCPGAEHLAAYADGSLDEGRRSIVENHVSGCRVCLAEVADLWRLAGPATHDAPDASAEAAVERLERDRRTARVRLTERALEVLQGFGASVADAARALDPPAAAPALVGSRPASVPVRLYWEGATGARVEAELTSHGEGLQLTGRVTKDGRPATAVSVTVAGPAGRTGPESPDSSGRFGPWFLDRGENVISLSGLEDARGGSTRLTVIVE